MTNYKSFLNALIKQKVLVLGTIFVCVVVSMLAFKVVPKKYKVTTAISIQPEYFKVPLVRDFIPETFDGGELRAQREGLIRRSLNHQYLRELGDRHKLFGKLNKEQVTSADLDELGKRFEIIPAGATSFMIGFFSTNPEAGYKIITDLVAHIRETLNHERRATLLRIHDAIEQRLESLSFGGRQVDINTLRSTRPDLVKKEIDRLTGEIESLKSTYSEKHPKVATLSRKLETLTKWYEKHPESTETDQVHSMNFSGDRVDPASKELFGDLLRKYHYLEVAIYLDEQSANTYLSVLQEPFVPKAPMWPKRSIFLVWGVIIGFLLGSVLALAREILPARRKEIETAWFAARAALLRRREA